eukprot:403365318
MLIGISVGTVVSFLKLFFPTNCPRYSMMLVAEQLDFYTFFNQMYNEDYEKNLFYLFQTGLTTFVGIPLTVSECAGISKEYELYRLSSAFINSLLQLVKMFVYLDTAFNFGLQGKFFMSGYYGMFSLTTMASFIATRVFKKFIFSESSKFGLAPLRLLIVILLSNQNFSFAKQTFQLEQKAIEDTDSWYPYFGQPSTIEMLIGISVGTVVSFLKLFFPTNCPRYSMMLVAEQLDFYTFFNQMYNEDYEKNLFYLFQTGLTTFVGIPLTVSECAGISKEYELYRLSSAFINSLLQLVKMFVYLDTAFNFGLQGKFFMSGYYGMFSLTTMASFIATRVFSG